MDAFQGCFKDGTNGTWDCRYFAAIYLIDRIAVYMSLAFFSIFFTNSVLFAVFAIKLFLLSCFHPHKKKFCNHLDIFLSLTVLVYMSSLWILQDSATGITEGADRLVLWMIGPIPIMYPLCLVLYYIWRKSRRLQSTTEWIKAFFPKCEQQQRWADSLPPRVILNETANLLNREGQHVP